MKSVFILALLLATVLPMMAATPATKIGDSKGVPKTGDYKGAKKDSIPENVWGIFTYEEAQKEAAKKKRPVAFLIIDERPVDPSEKIAAIKAFWAIEEDAITIVLRTGNAEEWKRLPELVQKSASSAELGKGSPKLIVFNDDVTIALAGMAFTKVIEASEKDLNKFGKEIKKLNTSAIASTDYPPPSTEEAPKPGAPATATPATATPATATVTSVAPMKPGETKPVDAKAVTAPAPANPVIIKDGKVENWTNTDGKVIQASLLEVNGEDITFQFNGSEVSYTLSKLSPESQKRVQELKAANSK